MALILVISPVGLAWMASSFDQASTAAEALSGEALARHLEAIALERDSAYGKLQEREAELARVQRIGRVGGVEVSFDNGFHNRRSPEYLAIHGLPPDAVNETHEDWVSRLHPNDRDETVRHFFNTLESPDEDYSAQYRIIRPNDGQIRWIGVTAKIERDHGGKPVRMIGAHIDITDRMLAQATLRESEERFRLIADSAPVPIWVTRLNRQRSFANQAYLDFLGLPFPEAIVFDWRKALHPDDLDRVLGEQIAGEASLKPFVLEARYRDAQGNWRWLRSESQPRWDPTGNHIGFIGVAHDITSAKEAENALKLLNETLERRIAERTSQLQSSEAQMRAVLETSNQYQLLMDQRGHIIFANRTALAGVGGAVANVVGKPLWQSPWFAQSEIPAKTIREALPAVVGGNDMRCEMVLSLPKGNRFFDVAMRPVFDQFGIVSSVLLEAVDITDRRESEEALRQSQKMEAVGQLTGGVAHDFNNLLTIIRSATDFLRRRDLPDERRWRYVDAISDTVDRASKLTSQLLAFARRQPLKPEVFDVGTQVTSISDLIRPLVGSRIAIDVDIDRHNQHRSALADIAQFETAIVNLAINGRDAMSGEGHLTIDVRHVGEIPPLRGLPRRAGDFIAVSVTDNGSGIEADKLEAIFEPFFTTKEVGRGTGLGLSQAFGFAKQSGGDIEVNSVVGRGARFTIYLPATAGRADKPAQAAAGTVEGISGKGFRVLIVEDNKDVGRYSTELLEELGYEITLAANAPEALAILGKDSAAHDLVFSDVIMPGMNGVDLAITIRANYPTLPVVLTSGYSNVLAENANHGFDLIQKPYSVEELSRSLRKAMRAAPR